MLDLVKQETERIDSRFLEPACGTGNFLAEVLKRKLHIVLKRYSKSQVEYERYAVLAISSIYGIDILSDNVAACQNRLFDIFDEQYRTLYTTKVKEECKKTVRFILSKNIVWGDALTLSSATDKNTPIVFSEWSPVNGSMMKRRDFTFAELLQNAEITALPLFSDRGEDVFIPKPIKDFPVTHFLRIADAD